MPLLHLDVSTPQGPELHLDVSVQQSLEVCSLGDIRNSAHGNYHGIPENFVQLWDTEFREIPWNFRQFRTEYGSYGRTKTRQNSVLTEFRAHPCCWPWRVPLKGQYFTTKNSWKIIYGPRKNNLQLMFFSKSWEKKNYLCIYGDYHRLNSEKSIKIVHIPVIKRTTWENFYILSFYHRQAWLNQVLCDQNHLTLLSL